MFFFKKNKTTRENVRRRAHAQKVLWIKYVQILSQHLIVIVFMKYVPNNIFLPFADCRAEPQR